VSYDDLDDKAELFYMTIPSEAHSQAHHITHKRL